MWLYHGLTSSSFQKCVQNSHHLQYQSLWSRVQILWLWWGSLRSKWRSWTCPPCWSCTPPHPPHANSAQTGGFPCSDNGPIENECINYHSSLPFSLELSKSQQNYKYNNSIHQYFNSNVLCLPYVRQTQKPACPCQVPHLACIQAGPIPLSYRLLSLPQIQSTTCHFLQHKSSPLWRSGSCQCWVSPPRVLMESRNIQWVQTVFRLPVIICILLCYRVMLKLSKTPFYI